MCIQVTWNFLDNRGEVLTSATVKGGAGTPDFLTQMYDTPDVEPMIDAW